MSFGLFVTGFAGFFLIDGKGDFKLGDDFM